jgi:DNA-binding MarR family transcriptional regulator
MRAGTKIDRTNETLDSALIAALDALIPRYSQELRSAITDAEGPDRLTMPQLRCLRAIALEGEHGAMTSRLAETTAVTVPTMSAMIDGLVARSLVDRRMDPDNRRRAFLFVTAQGTELLARYQSIMNARHREVVRALDDSKKRRTLDAALDLNRELTRMSRERNDSVGEQGS